MAESLKISQMVGSGTALSTDAVAIARSGANFQMPMSEIASFANSTFVPVAGRLSTDHIANAGTIILETAIPSIAANGVWAVVDPFTVQCEIRKVTLISGATLTIGTNLAFAHDQYDSVLLVSDAIANVLWFGAMGDGATDDTLAFQAAIDGIDTAGIGELYLPPGVYPITPVEGSRRGVEITSRSQITITGSREAIVKIADGVNVTTSWGELFWISSSTDIVLQGFTIDGNDSNADANHAVSIVNNSVRVTVRDMYIHDTTEDCVYISGPSLADVHILDNDLATAGRSGVVMTEGADVTIRGNTIKDATNSFIDLETNASEAIARVVIDGNKCLETGAGTATGISATSDLGTDGGITDLVITNNVMNIGGRMGAYRGITSGRIVGNTCRGDNSGAIFLELVGENVDVMVADNKLYNTAAATSTYNMIEANTNSKTNTRLQIVRNFLNDSDKNGITVGTGGAAIQVEYNEIDNSDSIGLGFTGQAGGRCKGNIVTTTGGIGISVSGASDNLIAENRVDTPTGEGILLTNCDRMKVVNNRVSGGTSDGFSFDDVNYSEWKGNHAYQCAYGFNSGGNNTHSTFEDCWAIESQEDGYQTATTDIAVNFVNCHAIDNGQNGATTGHAFQMRHDGCQFIGNYAADTGGGNQARGLRFDGSINNLVVMGNDLSTGHSATSGTAPLVYKPDPNGVFATDYAVYNL